jgi:hypothetical protein
MTSDPLRRPEDEPYRTEQATPEVAPSGDPLQPEASSPATASPPWIVVGLVLLAVFVGILLYAVVFPALS